MSIPVATIISRVQNTLLDPDEDYWTVPELIDYVNAAVTALINVKPDAYTVTSIVPLTTGTCFQEIPSNAYAFLDLTRQVTPVQRAITQVDRNTLDHADPNWYSASGTAVKQYVFDSRDPRTFYVYPAPSVSVTVEMSYSAEPTRATTEADSLDLDSVYENPIYDYVMCLAFAKNSKRGDLGKAVQFFQMFTTHLGLKNQVQFPFSPKVPQDKR